jgi:hypothetical protein
VVKMSSHQFTEKLEGVLALQLAGSRYGKYSLRKPFAAG